MGDAEEVVDNVAEENSENKSQKNEEARAEMLARPSVNEVKHFGGYCLLINGSDSNSGDAKNNSIQKNPYKDPDDGRQRFLLELEFVQCLANPTYIHYLAQNRYFEDEAFIGYLKYLQYWQRPEYIKFIMYPHCLFFLELLQNANFRLAMAHPGNKELAHRQQFYLWKSYRNNRLKHILPRSLPEQPPNPGTAAPPSLPLPAGSTSAAPAQSPHLPPTTISAATAATAAMSSQAPSPMQYTMSGGVAKNDIRNSGLDRKRRK